MDARIYAVRILVLVLVVCVTGVLSCGWGSGGRSRRRTPYYVPPTTVNLQCPASQSPLAPRGEVGLRVSWSKPTVKNHNSHATVYSDTFVIRQIEGPPSGSFFSDQGLHKIRYKVSYNTAKYHFVSNECEFTVRVRVMTCPMPPTLTHGLMQCTTNRKNTYGTSCTSTCNEGYEHRGQSSITCGSNGQWDYPFPTCRPLSCGNPGTITDGDFSCPYGHVYPQLCHINCRPGYTPTGATFIKCGKDRKWSKGSSCHDVQAPKFPKGCPADQRLFAGPRSAPVTLDWDDPEVKDNDKMVSVGSSMEKGALLGPGTYAIRLTATDQAANTASCSFAVEVLARKCPPLSAPAKGTIICSHGYVEGSECDVTCKPGYQLQGQGQGQLICEASEEWSVTVPSCEATECSLPPEVQHGYFKCESGQAYQSICLLVCIQGFQPRSPVSIHCKEDGSWTPPGFCADVTPPVFVEGCPASKDVTAPRLGQPARVNWSEPVVTDSGGSNVTVSCQPSAGSSFPAGRTKVECSATDASGNVARCSFQIIVSVLSCTKPDLEPAERPQKAMLYDCPDGHVYGASCSLSCLSTFPLRGPSNITCEKDPNAYPYTTSWSWDGITTPDCIISTCPVLNPPVNGALSCYQGNYAKECFMSCSDPYDVPVTMSGHFRCFNSDGHWRPDLVPGCSQKQGPRGARMNGDIFYYAGSCSNDTEMLRQAFITRFNKVSRGGCSQDSHCNVDNVEVTCGPISPRYKREVDIRRSDRQVWADDLLSPPQYSRVRRQVSDTHRITFSYSILVSIPQGSNKTDYQIFQEVIATKNALFSSIDAKANSGDLDIEGLTIDPFVGYMTFTLDCPPGLVGKVKYPVLSCVGCFYGHHEKSGKCHPCPVGSYSDIDNGTFCIPCPQGWTTLAPGSTNSSACQELCAPGSMSLDGFAPCELCPLGQFQSREGAMTCDLCPVNTWTENMGSNGSELCLPADVVLTNNSVSANIRGNWTLLTVMLWVSMSDNHSLDITMKNTDGSDLLSYQLFTSSNSPGQNSPEFRSLSIPSASEELPVEKWSHVTFVVMSPALSATFLSEEIAVLILTQQPANETALSLRSSTKKGTVSISGLAAYARLLTKEELAIITTSCMVDNSKTLLSWLPSPDVISVPSECDAVNECEASPCGEHGTCQNLVGSFVCQCGDGWTGDLCRVPPSPCHQHQCQNNATCLPAEKWPNYTCVCPPGYTGKTCQLDIIDGGWGEWSEYSECSANCVGTQHRQRHCNNPPPANDGHPCPGFGFEIRECGESVCVVPGNWNEWSTWSHCSASCEGGETTRQRTCDKSAESDTMRVECEGRDREIETCNTWPCPVHGGWGKWSDWSSCSVTCGRGQKSRERSCDSPAPSDGGSTCKGRAKKIRRCNLQKCPECSPLIHSKGSYARLNCIETRRPEPYEKICQLECLGGKVPSDGVTQYRCGENSSYLWNNQISRHSPALLPHCIDLKKLESATYSQTTGMNAGCDNDSRNQVVLGLRRNLESRVTCLKLGTCQYVLGSTCKSKGRKTDAPSLDVSLELKFTNETKLTLTENNTVGNYEYLVGLAEDSVRQLTMNDTESIFTITTSDDRTITPNMDTVSFNIDTNCSLGQVYREKYCVECPEGTKEVDGVCEPCPPGQYQDQSGSTSCRMCPEGLTGGFYGATNITQCQVKCPVGTREVEGVCEQCPPGQYQDEEDSTNCKFCPEGLNAGVYGARDIEQCRVKEITATDSTAGSTSTTLKIYTSTGDGVSSTSTGDGVSSTSTGDGESSTSTGDGESSTSTGDGDSSTSTADGDNSTTQKPTTTMTEEDIKTGESSPVILVASVCGAVIALVLVVLLVSVVCFKRRVWVPGNDVLRNTESEPEMQAFSTERKTQN